MEIALVHNLAVTITGDIIPSDKILKAEKVLRERLAYGFFRSLDPEAGPMLEALWQEYEDNMTPAASFVHDVDLLQRLDQAFKYAIKYPALDFSDFKEDATCIRDTSLQE